MAISQDGKVMAAQTGGDKIALWDLTTKRQIADLPGSASIRRLALSPNGNLLAVGTLNARGEPTVEVWDVPARMIRGTLNLRSPVRSLAVSPDESLLATFDNKGNIALVDWASNRTLTNLSVRAPSTWGRGSGGLFSRWKPIGDWRRLRADSHSELAEGNHGGDDEPDPMERGSHGAGFFAFLGTARHRIWNPPSASGTPARENLEGNGPTSLVGVSALAFTPDGQRLASAAATERSESGAWRTGSNCAGWRGHESEGMALAFLPDGKTLVSGCNVGTACFWDLTATNRTSGHTSLPISMGPGLQAALPAESWEPGTDLDPKVVRRFGFTFTPDSRSFITTDPDGSLAVWNTRSVQQTESLPALGSNNWGVALSPDGHWLATGEVSGRVNVWDWTARRRVASFEVPFEWLGHLRFSRSGRYLWAMVLFNDWTSGFRIWRTEDWREVPLASRQAADTWWADFSPNDRLLATGHRSGAVRLWDFPSGQHETTFTNQAGAVAAVLFSPDGGRLASTSFDGTVILRDLFAHREVTVLRGHPGPVGGAAFSPDGRRLATGGAGTKDAVRLWDLATQRELLSLQGEGELVFDHVAFSPDGSTLMATSFAGIAHLWRAPSWAEIEAAEKGQVTP